jgi:hypothetical protein
MQRCELQRLRPQSLQRCITGHRDHLQHHITYHRNHYNTALPVVATTCLSRRGLPRRWLVQLTSLLMSLTTSLSTSVLFFTDFRRKFVERQFHPNAMMSCCHVAYTLLSYALPYWRPTSCPTSYHSCRPNVLHLVVCPMTMQLSFDLRSMFICRHSFPSSHHILKPYIVRIW